MTTYFIELYNDNLVDLYFILDNKTNKTNLEPPKLDIKMDAKVRNNDNLLSVAYRNRCNAQEHGVSVGMCMTGGLEPLFLLFSLSSNACNSSHIGQLIRS